MLENGKKSGKGGGCNKDREKCILESRIKFPDQKWTVDTPHGPYKKFLKNVRQMQKNEVGNVCWFLIQKLDPTK